jgi:hypothetical protein
MAVRLTCQLKSKVGGIVMSGKRHSTWIHIWRSLKWPSHTRLHDAAQAVTETETSPIPPPLPVPADPAYEAVDRLETAAEAFVKVPPIPPLLPVIAEPTCEADEPTETTVSVQSSRPTTDFALPGRLAVVAKLNVPSIRAPRHRPYRLPPGKAVPLAARAQPAHVGRSPRLEAMKPTTRLIVQKPAAPISAVVIHLEAVRKAVQFSPAAKRAA